MNKWICKSNEQSLKNLKFEHNLTLNLKRLPWKLNHKLTRKGCDKDAKISISLKTLSTASLPSHWLLFMYFIANICFVSLFRTIHTFSNQRNKCLYCTLKMGVSFSLWLYKSKKCVKNDTLLYQELLTFDNISTKWEPWCVKINKSYVVLCDKYGVTNDTN